MATKLEAKLYTPWELIKTFWQSEHRRYAYTASALILLMTISLVALDVGLSYWANYFYNTLQEYNKPNAIRLLILFFALAAIFMTVQVIRFYVTQIFGLRWRRWLTHQFVRRWLENRSYYYLEVFDRTTDNPDQRIQEDIGSLVTYTLSLVVGLISALTTFVGFIYVLWELSGSIRFSFFGLFDIVIKGYLVWVTVIYSLVGTYLTFKIGKPLIALNFEQQRREATFRFAAIDLRSHSENVALYRAEDHEKVVLKDLFSRVLENWLWIIKRETLLLSFTAGFNQISVALPLIVALPQYFAKVFLLGGLMQSIRAFSSVQEAASFLVNSYNTIALWRAVIARLVTFLNHAYEAEEHVAKQDKLIFSRDKQKEIAVKQLNIETPRGEKLLSNINKELTHGQNYLIKGESGIGKSTLVRVIAGIWPYASGEVALPLKQSIMYLPQQTYMPIGTFEESILFPDKISSMDKKQLHQILKKCGLEQFQDRLYEKAVWSDQLSPGEQQRVAFARVLAHKPDWVFLDESTSALDLKSEKEMYEMLKSDLPNCSVVSVGHRPSLDAYHDHVIDLTEYA